VREAQLDPSFVCDWTSECYADRGRPSIDSIVFFTLQLAVFFERTQSERKLIETASLHLAHRYSLAYALNQALPDRSSLTCIANTPALRVADTFTLSANQSTASRDIE
jgi:hypothetical protein